MDQHISLGYDCPDFLEVLMAACVALAGTYLAAPVVDGVIASITATAPALDALETVTLGFWGFLAACIIQLIKTFRDFATAALIDNNPISYEA